MSNSGVLLILGMSLISTLAKPTFPLGRGKLLDNSSSISSKIEDFNQCEACNFKENIFCTFAKHVQDHHQLQINQTET